MRLRNTIIVLILLLVFGGYSLIILLGSRPVPPPTLLNLDHKHISGIDLRYPDRELELVRNPNHTWNILKPIKTDSDQGAVDGLTETIANAQLTRTIEEKPDSLKPFGLDKPAVTLTVTTDNKGVLPALLVGRISPVSNAVYVKLANQPAVLMTTGDFVGAITKNVNDLRSHELMTFNMDDADQIVLRSGVNQPIEIDRQGGQWRIVAPGHYAADSDTVAQILTALVDARIADFVTDAPTDLGQYGLKNPQIEVSVYSGRNKTRYSLLFGLEQPQASKKAVYVKRGDEASVYTVEDALLTKVNLGLFDLRDKTVMGFDPLKVGRLEIENHGKQFTLSRDAAGKWQVTNAGKSSPANGQAVQTFLDELANLKGDKIVQDPMTDPRRFAMDKPTEQIVVFGKDDKQIGTVKLAQVQNQVQTPATPSPDTDTEESKAKTERTVMRIENYATSSAGTTVYSLREPDFSQFDMSGDQFEATQPLAAPAPPKK
ncbi:MAG TPA: DUF4340 domain-containing protein [Candidatus Binataceae bacterium]|nr:DUF4340 domain-containing protein [Candidatus Binataceae bacterium]